MNSLCSLVGVELWLKKTPVFFVWGPLFGTNEKVSCAQAVDYVSAHDFWQDFLYWDQRHHAHGEFPQASPKLDQEPGGK